MNEKLVLKTAINLHSKFLDIIPKCKFFEIDEYEVKYISNSKCRWDSLMCGPMRIKSQKDSKINEKESITKKTKNYYKLFYNNNKLLKIESYIKNRIDVVYLCYYFKNLRILKPFTPDGGFYPTYTLVTEFFNDEVVKEILLDSNQVIFENYIYKKDCIEYEIVNCVPNSPNRKILAYSKGVLTDNASKYNQTENFVWYEK